MGTIRLIVAGLLLVGASFWLWAESPEPAYEVDFGLISGLEIVSTTIAIDVDIVNVVVPCECVLAHILPQEDKGRPVLSLQFDPSGYRGPVVQDITLIDRQNQLITVRVKAQVEELTR